MAATVVNVRYLAAVFLRENTLSLNANFSPASHRPTLEEKRSGVKAQAKTGGDCINDKEPG
jgi:hypothetical protein